MSHELDIETMRLIYCWSRAEANAHAPVFRIMILAIPKLRVQVIMNNSLFQVSIFPCYLRQKKTSFKSFFFFMSVNILERIVLISY